MKNKTVQLIVGLCISAVFLYLAFRKVEFSQLWETMKTIKYIYVIPFVIITLGSMYLRGIRWRYFLLPKYDIKSSSLFSPLIIGFALNGIFPGRVGEFARPYVLYKKEDVPFPAGLATVVVERIIDGITILILFAIALNFLPAFDPNISITWDNTSKMTGQQITSKIFLISEIVILISAAVLFYLKPSKKGDKGLKAMLRANPGLYKSAAAAVIFVILIALGIIAYFSISNPYKPDQIYPLGKKWELNAKTLDSLATKTTYMVILLIIGTLLMMVKKTRQFFQNIMMKVPFIPVKIKSVFNNIIEHFSEGLSSLQNPVYVFWIVLYSVIIWVTVGLSLWVMGLGFSEFHLSFSQATAIMVIICFAIMIPAAPGYWGIYEYGCIFAMAVLGVTQNQAAAMGFSIMIHALQMIPIIIIGLIYLVKEQISISEFAEKQSELEDKPS